jgi:hypothetical protein
MSKLRKIGTGKPIDALVANMVAEGAKKPLPHPLKQMGFWLTGVMVYLVTVSAYGGFRTDIGQKLTEPSYLLELVLLFLMALFAGFAALCLSRPDGRQMPWVRYIPFVFLILWSVTAFAGGGDMRWTTLCYTMTLGQFDCFWHILLFSVPSGLAMFLIVRKGAPVECCWAGMMATWSVTSFGYLFMRLVETTDNAPHLIVWHALPIVATCMAGMIAGKYALRRR